MPRDPGHALVIRIAIEPLELLVRRMPAVVEPLHMRERLGQMEFEEQEKQTVGPDTLIDSPKDVVHCHDGESDAPLRFLVVKVPRPTRTARLL